MISATSCTKVREIRAIRGRVFDKQHETRQEPPAFHSRLIGYHYDIPLVSGGGEARAGSVNPNGPTGVSGHREARELEGEVIGHATHEDHLPESELPGHRHQSSEVLNAETGIPAHTTKFSGPGEEPQAVHVFGRVSYEPFHALNDYKPRQKIAIKGVEKEKPSGHQHTRGFA